MLGLKENKKKRKDFYDKLKKIKFNPEVLKKDLKTFQSKFKSDVVQLQKLCADNAEKRKGSTSKNMMKELETGSSNLATALDKLPTGGSLINGEVVVKVVNHMNELRDSLFFTGNFIYPHLIHKAMLDYKPTRKYLFDLHDHIKNCREVLLALVNKNNCNVVLEMTKDLNPDEKGFITLTDKVDFFRSSSKKSSGFIWYGDSEFDFQSIDRFMECMEKSGKYLDLSNEIEELKKLHDRFNTVEKQCAKCGKKSEKNIIYLGCHYVCRKCIEKAYPTILSNFVFTNDMKCPVKGCKNKIKLDLMRYYKKHASSEYKREKVKAKKKTKKKVEQKTSDSE